MNPLEKLERLVIYLTVFLVPLVVLLISPNPFVVGKLAVLFFGVSLAFLIKVLRTIISGKLEYSVGNFDFPILLLALAYIASTILRTPNKMEALLLPGTTTLTISAILLYFLINQLDKKGKDLVRLAIAGSGVVFSLSMILARLGVFAKIPQLPAVLKHNLFSPAGGYLPSGIFLASLVPLGIGIFLAEKNARKKLGLGAGLAIIILGLGLSIYSILPGRPNAPKLPSFNTSWFITIDSLKESPFLGVGPGNYLTAFNRFRPITYNSTDLWAIRFSTANDYYLTIFTETGLLGAAGLILLVLAIYRLVKKDFKEKKMVGWGFAGSSNLIALLLIAILLALFPATPALLVLLFVLLALNTKVHKNSLDLTSKPARLDSRPDSARLAAKRAGKASPVAKNLASRLPAILVTLPVLLITVFAGYKVVGFLRAEIKFRDSLVALAQNEGIKSYDEMREAVNLNPQVDRYHASYSQVNLALANTIAGNEDISDADRNNIAQLVQQAIREGKATVALNPLRAGNWEILAKTYQAIIPLATGADLFSAQTYSQAIALDPLNPNLRIALGGLHFAAGNFETAIRIFELAVATKPDLANAHYNLAFALTGENKMEQAIQEMTLVLSLVDRDSQDYENARSALEEMETKKAELTAEGTENLVPPQPAEGPVIEPPLELPEESEPPEAPITPTPTPTPDEQQEETEEEPGASDETTPFPTPTIIP